MAVADLERCNAHLFSNQSTKHEQEACCQQPVLVRPRAAFTTLARGTRAGRANRNHSCRAGGTLVLQLPMRSGVLTFWPAGGIQSFFADMRAPGTCQSMWAYRLESAYRLPRRFGCACMLR